MGLEFEINGTRFLIINVYLPYCSDQNKEEFIYCVNRVNSIVEDFSSPYVYILGDFNADVTTNNEGNIPHKFGDELNSFVTSEGLILADVKQLTDQNIYTYYDGNGVYSWLDHVLCTQEGEQIINKIEILYDFITSDHHPLLLEIECAHSHCKPTNVGSKIKNSIKWNKMSKDEICKYTKRTGVYLENVHFHHDMLLCDNVKCTDTTHRKAIDNMYNEINDALLKAGKEICESDVKKECQKLGWNDYCKIAHNEARSAYLLWRNCGKPRQGIYFENMRKTRSYFKYTLRTCKKNNDRLVSDKLAKQLLCKNDQAFWKEIKKLKGNCTVLASTIDGVTGENNIANKWKTHFSTLFNSSQDTSRKDKVIDSITNHCDREFVRITGDEIKKSIKQAKSNKSCGRDGLYSEHYKYANERIYVLLALLYNAIAIHGHVPECMMDSLLVPLVKDKKGSLTSSDNYRPLMLTNIASKILELVILDRYEEKLCTSDNQFGFKAKHATDMCVFTLKYILEYYKNLNSLVYICFLDLSKAFDKVNHWILFDKLLDRKIPVIIVRILVIFYCQQKCYVNWGGMLSTPFSITNGVRQGGILSPYLFNIFTDELSYRLSNSGVGCQINGMPINHLQYADDSVILAPTPNALQKLLDICGNFALEVELMYNIKKTVCMAIKPKWLKDIENVDVYLNNKPIKLVTEHKYLGIMISQDLCDDIDIKQQKRALYARGNVLIAKFRKCSMDVKCKLFKAYCSSLYGSNLWCNYHTHVMSSLKYAHNIIFSKLMQTDIKNVQFEMIQRNIDVIDVIIRKLQYSLFSRICDSKNNLLKCIMDSLHFCDSKMFLEWRRTFF